MPATTNRIDSAPAYQDLKVMGAKVVELLGIETSATHMEWFYGPKGLKFSEIGCRPPGVRAWDLYNVGNDMDLYREWSHAVCYGRPQQTASRRMSAGIIALRPDRDGHIAGYEGLDAIGKAFGANIIDVHLPPEGHPTQPVEAGYMANAWLRARHRTLHIGPYYRGWLHLASTTIGATSPVMGASTSSSFCAGLIVTVPSAPVTDPTCWAPSRELPVVR